MPSEKLFIKVAASTVCLGKKNLLEKINKVL